MVDPALLLIESDDQPHRTEARRWPEIARRDESRRRVPTATAPTMATSPAAATGSAENGVDHFAIPRVDGVIAAANHRHPAAEERLAHRRRDQQPMQQIGRHDAGQGNVLRGEESERGKRPDFRVNENGTVPFGPRGAWPSAERREHQEALHDDGDDEEMRLQRMRRSRLECPATRPASRELSRVSCQRKWGCPLSDLRTRDAARPAATNRGRIGARRDVLAGRRCRANRPRSRSPAKPAARAAIPSDAGRREGVAAASESPPPRPPAAAARSQ